MGMETGEYGIEKGGNMYYNAYPQDLLKFVPHVFASLLRQNPALPLHAKSPYAAISKIAAAGTLLQAIIEAERAGIPYDRFLALEAMDLRSQYTLPQMARYMQLSIPIGSTRKQAADAGGYYGVAVERAAEWEFSGKRLNRYISAEAEIKMLVSAFPYTWQAAISMTEYSYSSHPSYVRGAIAKALACEWDVLPKMLPHKHVWKLDEIALEVTEAEEKTSIIMMDGCLFFCRLTPGLYGVNAKEQSLPRLEPERDGEWHLIPVPHQFKYIAMVGWYTSIEDQNTEDQISIII
jgi:hypothetical protein